MEDFDQGPETKQVAIIGDIKENLAYDFSTNQYIHGEFINPQAKEAVVQSLVKLVKENDTLMLKALDLMTPQGSTYEEVVRKLSKEYDLPENTMVAARIWDFTRLQWASNNRDIDISDPETQMQIKQRLPKLKKLAKQLSGVTLTATHQTRTKEAAEQIEKSGKIRASKDGDFEGAGVYFGALGGFPNWASAKTFETQIQLKHTYPKIVDSQDPEAMLNVLYQEVSLNGEPIGFPLWKKADHPDKVDQWQIDALKAHLTTKIEVRQSGGWDVLVIDTDEDPIVWAALCDALHIGKVVKKEDVDKLSGIWDHPIISKARNETN